MTDVVQKAIEARQKKYEEKHGEQVTKEDYNKYKESFVVGKKSYDLAKPLSFKDYRDIAMFRGKKATENADLSTVAKTGIDADKYRAKKKATPKGMADRKKTSTKKSMDFRKGGMVLSTVDNRKVK